MKNAFKFLLYLIAAVILFNYPGSLQAQYKYSTQPKVQTVRDSQGLEFSASGAYFFGGILPVSTGELNFKNNYGFQGAITYNIMQGAGVDLSYMYVPSELSLRDFQNYGEETKLFDMDVHYFFIDYLYQNESRKSVPYGLLGIGGFIADPKDNNYESEFRFATTFGGGIKIYPSSKVGLKFQARLLIPVYYSSSTVFVTPSGTGYTAGAGALLQADLSLGLTIKF